MAYQIVLSDGVTVLTNIPDNTVDSTTSLTLLGRNYPGYGQMVADNFVHLLENAAGPTPPARPLVGQLWYNKTTGLLNVWSGGVWVAFSGGVSSVLGFTGAVTVSQLSGGTASSGFLAPLTSPAFLGVPTTASTPDSTDNSLKLATTAFVKTAVSGVVGGVSSVINRQGDISLAQLIAGGLAPLASPSFVGTPTTTLPHVNDSSNQIPTTSWVVSKIGASSAGVSSVLGSSGAITLSNLTNPVSGGGVAPLDSPTFTTAAYAPTAATGTATTQLATTAFVANTKAALLSGTNTWSGANTHTGNIVLANNVGVYGKDTGGTPHLALAYSTDNYLVLACGTSGLRIVNTANINTLVLDNSGNVTVHGGIVAAGYAPSTADSGQIVARNTHYDLMIRNDDVTSYLLLSNSGGVGHGYNGLRPLTITNKTGAVSIDGSGVGTWFGGAVSIIGAMTASGNVTANGARLRAAYGYTAGDGNAAVIGADFASGWHDQSNPYSEDTSGGYQKLPNGLIINWQFIIAHYGDDYHNFPLGFGTACLALVISTGASMPPSQPVGADLQLGSGGNPKWTFHTYNATGTNGCYVISIGY